MVRRIGIALTLLLALQPLAALGAAHPHREGEMIVKYREGVPRYHRDFLRGRYGAEAVREYPRARMERVRVRHGLTVDDAVREVRTDPDVEYAEPDYVVTTLGTSNDPQLSNLWGLAKIGAPAAWDLATGSGEVTVAVIDTGVDWTHPDLAANLWSNAAEVNGLTGVDDDGNGVVDDLHGYNAVANTGDPADDHGHGTHVAGTIGAVGNNAVGVVGVNWNVTIVACKFLDAAGSGYVSDAIECLEYVRALRDRGVNVVATNNSWGGGGYSQALADAVAAQGDVLFVAAAGNDGVDSDLAPQYPAGLDLPNVLAVAATDSADNPTWFSNFGRRTVDLAAPGSGILSTMRGGGYGTMSGTSMAAPHVTGVAALLSAAAPSLNGWALRNLILAGAAPQPALEGVTVTGGRLDALGSLACSGRRVVSALSVPNSLPAGVAATLSALSIDCASAVGPVIATLTTGQTVSLADDGVSPDRAAGDGIFTARFTPASAAAVYAIASPAGTDTLSDVVPLSVSTSSLPGAAVGVAYRQVLAAVGGQAPHVWAVASGYLPSGLTLTSSTGVLSGTPRYQGTSSFTVRVTDATGARATRALSVKVAAAPLTLTTASPGGGTVGRAYGVTLAATGGVKPYGWSLAAGSLPPGLTLTGSTGRLSGTPTTTGLYAFTACVTDAAGTAATRALTINVVIAPLAVSTSTLPGATVGRSYAATLAATGGVAPYGWAFTTGALPAGVTLEPATGRLSGTPTAAGTFSLTVQVADSRGVTATRALTLRALIGTLSLTTTSLPAAPVGAWYSRTLAANGGVAPYAWSVASGTLPAGLSLDRATGVLSGTPTAARSASVTFRVTDARGVAASRTLTVTAR